VFEGALVIPFTERLSVSASKHCWNRMETVLIHLNTNKSLALPRETVFGGHLYDTFIVDFTIIVAFTETTCHLIFDFRRRARLDVSLVPISGALAFNRLRN
jgi:hypothetical protein